MDTLNTPYDYGSVMHYGKYFFTQNGLPTIEPLQANVTIGQRQNLSSIDILEVRLIYNCSALGVTLPPITNDTTSESTTHSVFSQKSNPSVRTYELRVLSVRLRRNSSATSCTLVQGLIFVFFRISTQSVSIRDLNLVGVDKQQPDVCSL